MSDKSILIACSDLMLTSQIDMAIRQADCAAKTTLSIDAIVDAVNAGSCAGIVVDLGSGRFTPSELMDALPEQRPPIVGFGPHVHVAKLQAARDAGFDFVMSRGQFVSGHAELFAGFANSSG